MTLDTGRNTSDGSSSQPSPFAKEPQDLFSHRVAEPQEGPKKELASTLDRLAKALPDNVSARLSVWGRSGDFNSTRDLVSEVRKSFLVTVEK